MYQKISVKMPNMKTNENPFISSEVACRQTDTVKLKKCIFTTSHCECTKENKYMIYIIRS
jgi:hypothetical protein